jgi:hypothetical protein
MLSDPEVDVVLIATPYNLHADQAVRAIEAGNGGAEGASSSRRVRARS